MDHWQEWSWLSLKFGVVLGLLAKDPQVMSSRSLDLGRGPGGPTDITYLLVWTQVPGLDQRRWC